MSMMSGILLKGGLSGYGRRAMKTTRMVSDDWCLDCKTRLDSITDVLTNATPKPNDFSICFRCGHVMAFGPDLKVRALTDAEIVELAGDPRLVKIQTARGTVMKLREIAERSGRK
jgi:hypothetical protein